MHLMDLRISYATLQYCVFRIVTGNTFWKQMLQYKELCLSYRYKALLRLPAGEQLLVGHEHLAYVTNITSYLYVGRAGATSVVLSTAV